MECTYGFHTEPIWESHMYDIHMGPIWLCYWGSTVAGPVSYLLVF